MKIYCLKYCFWILCLLIGGMPYAYSADDQNQEQLRKLHKAVSEDKKDEVKALLASGVNPNVSVTTERYAVSGSLFPSIWITMPLEEAISARNIDMMELLLGNGANPNLHFNNGRTPLGHTINSFEPHPQRHKSMPPPSTEMLKAVELLLKHKAQVDLPNQDIVDYTPLHLAVLNIENPQSQYKVAELLLENGADPYRRHKYNGTPYRDAQRLHDQRCPDARLIKLLAKYRRCPLVPGRNYMSQTLFLSTLLSTGVVICAALMFSVSPFGKPI